VLSLLTQLGPNTWRVRVWDGDGGEAVRRTLFAAANLQVTVRK